MTRTDGRAAAELRPVKIEPDVSLWAEGSVLISCGNTRVLCTATVEEGSADFLRGTGRGWVTAEYSMLPRATQTRSRRDIAKLKLSPRSAEIQRLVGRALRAAVDLAALGERTVTVDCDVLQADGGTRTASVTGGYVALALALTRLYRSGVLEKNPLTGHVAAVSVGIVDGAPALDLCYREDSAADVDMNVVMNADGDFIEVQGTGEHAVFGRGQLDAMLNLAEGGIRALLAEQRRAVEAGLAGEKA